MEFSNRLNGALFVVLVFLLATAGKKDGEDTSATGVWCGELSTVTAHGGMISTVSGDLWVSNSLLSDVCLKGDSLLVLGYRRGKFVTSWAVRLKPSDSFVSLLRRSYRKRLMETIPDSVARGLTGGLLMGLRGMIPAETAEVFKSTGTSHLLALSGLHTGIVALVFLYLARFVFGKGHLSGWVTTVGIVLFVLLSGGRPSTVRAGIMASTTVFWMTYHGGRLHLLTVWWTALALSLIFVPETLHDRGAQMSYGAVLSLILFGKNPGGKLAVVFSPLYAGTVVIGSLAPLLNAVYGGISPWGPVATVVSMPFLLAVMALGFVSTLGSGVAAGLLAVVSNTWVRVLDVFSCAKIPLGSDLFYPVWLLLLVVFRVVARWNGFHRRLR